MGRCPSGFHCNIRSSYDHKHIKWRAPSVQAGALNGTWHVLGEVHSKLNAISHGVPCKYHAPLLFKQYVSRLPCLRLRILILQAVVNASGIRSTTRSTPNSSFYVTVVVLRKKVCKTTTSSGPTPTWDTSCELLVVSLCRLSIFVDTCPSASRMVESSSVLSFSLKRSRGTLVPVLLVGSVNIRTIDLLHQCSGEQRKLIMS